MMGYKNSEGYADPTAFFGMQAQVKEDAEQDAAIHRLIHIFRDIAGFAGFEIVGRVTFKHKKTGKVFK